MFGYPLTEEYSAPELGENGVVTQWFERARCEWHPGNIPARNDVLQGHLGERSWRFSPRIGGRVVRPLDSRHRPPERQQLLG